MKQLLLITILLISSLNASAGVIEGRLVSKLQGELDAFTLGDGCISIIEFFDVKIKDLVIIGIYEANEDNCLSTDVDENDEIDFNPSHLIPIVNLTEFEAVSSLARSVLGVDETINFYKLK